MLQNLHVKNLALIDEADVAFGEGLNILSGETGAGKSLLIGSIHLALGEKVPRDMLRENAENALVELTFSVEQPHQIQTLEAMDVSPEDGQILMTRRITSSRSVCRINGETVSAARMRQVASVLIDIHGQQEHQSLLAKHNHLRYLDEYARRELGDRPAALAECYRAYTDCKTQMEEASLDEEQQERELSLVRYEIDEIEQAHLTPGEDEELEADYRRFANGRKILEAADTCRDCCADGPDSASNQIGRAVKDLLGVAEYDDTVRELARQLGEIDTLLSDFNRDLSGYLDDFAFSEERYEEIGARLDEINRLKSKYGRTIPDVLAQLAERRQREEQLTHYEEYRRELAARCEESEQALANLSREVSDIRREAAERFAAEIRQALADLNFADVRLELRLERLDHYTANGWDDARFFISTNPGEAIRPLDAVASGGELSRIMLAIKTVLAEGDDIETLIFDEIDAGISGRTAQMVGEKIRQTARSHQVICITHLPQIAAMAQTHFLIEKTSDADSTISEIRPLTEAETIGELARMLGGAEITDAAMENAREMRAMAERTLDP